MPTFKTKMRENLPWFCGTGNLGVLCKGSWLSVDETWSSCSLKGSWQNLGIIVRLVDGALIKLRYHYKESCQGVNQTLQSWEHIKAKKKSPKLSQVRKSYDIKKLKESTNLQALFSIFFPFFQLWTSLISLVFAWRGSWF